MIRTLHVLLALLLLLSPTLALAESHTTWGIRIEQSVTTSADSVAEADHPLTMEQWETRQTAVNDLPTRLRLSLMIEHGRLVDGIDLDASLEGYRFGRDADAAQDEWSGNGSHCRSCSPRRCISAFMTTATACLTGCCWA